MVDLEDFETTLFALMDIKNLPEVAKHFVYVFLDALQKDLYPPAEAEKVFGLEMPTTDPHIGSLTYGAWKTLYRNSLINENDLAQALLNGTLPAYFEEKVISVYELYKSGKKSQMYIVKHVPELIKRGFDQITWDDFLLRRLSDNRYTPKKKNDMRGEFPLGQSVQIIGLNKSVDLNGKFGKVVGPLKDGRIPVQVEGKEAGVRIKPANLKMSEASPILDNEASDLTVE